MAASADERARWYEGCPEEVAVAGSEVVDNSRWSRERGLLDEVERASVSSFSSFDAAALVLAGLEDAEALLACFLPRLWQCHVVVIDRNIYTPCSR